jgi:twitching motility protein PilT
MDFKQKLEGLMENVIKENGSDLHLSEGRHPIIRVNGFLLPLIKEPVITKADMDGYINELLTPENKESMQNKKEVDFAYNYHEIGRFRGNAFFQKGSVSVALRLIPSKIKTLEELNLPPILETFANKQKGFFLVVGPTGHGKSTTLASMIEIINNKRLDHVITIEDPIEYIFQPNKAIIDQREIKIDTPDFRAALTGVFRQDVDVVMIGEMRDPETMSTAVTAAETGHLVMSTLHTNTASQTIERIIDSFVANQQDQIRYQLANTLIAIFSQRLIPRINGGLIPAVELLINNTAVSNLIRENRVHEVNTVIETSSQEGMIDMNRSLVDLVKTGEISIENAFLYSNNPKLLERMM